MIQNWLSQFNLNQQQEAAVTYVDGPLFVIAGAGTGKTKTLTAKIAYLIYEKNISPNNIVAFTFTNKAAREIKERTELAVNFPVYGMWLNTFHSFGLKVLKEDIDKLNIGYQKNFSIIDEDDALKIIRDIIKAHNIDSKKYSARKAKSLISEIKYNNIFKTDDRVYDKIIEFYEAELINNQLLDFDDLICYTRKLFISNKDVLRKYQEKFDYILVDEFQDTDKYQYDIIALLGKLKRSVFLVGDPDQSIYGFRGANYLNNEKFIKQFAAKVIILDKNYRSTNAILKKANTLISQNSGRVDTKNLASDLGEGYPVSIFGAESDYQEAQFVTNQIEALYDQGYKYSDIAVLYRYNALSRVFEDTFIRNQVPYIIYGGISFYERREIKDILAYLRVILDYNNNFYLKRIINVPKRGIGNTTVEKLESYANNNGLSMFESLLEINISASTKSKLTQFHSLIDSMKQEIDEATELKEIINIIALKSGYIDLLKADGDDASIERIKNIGELASVFASNEHFYEGTREEKIRQILDQIALYTDKDKDVSQTDSVILSTYHQVKGLEFKAVFMVVMEQGVFPDQRAYFSIADFEEERRVAYVGMTRAKQRLFLTFSSRRLLYGTITSNEPSVFINDAIGKEVVPQRTPIKRQPVEGNRFKLSENVNHDVFGEGVVVGIEDDNIIKVAFKMPHGIKLLNQHHPAIKKVKN